MFLFNYIDAKCLTTSSNTQIMKLYSVCGGEINMNDSNNENIQTHEESEVFKLDMPYDNSPTKYKSGCSTKSVLFSVAVMIIVILTAAFLSYFMINGRITFQGFNSKNNSAIQTSLTDND